LGLEGVREVEEVEEMWGRWRGGGGVLEEAVEETVRGRW